MVGGGRLHLGVGSWQGWKVTGRVDTVSFDPAGWVRSRSRARGEELGTCRPSRKEGVPELTEFLLM